MEPQNRDWWGGAKTQGSAEATATDAGNIPPSGRPWPPPGLAQDLRTGRASEQVKAKFPSPQRALLPPPQPTSHPALLPGSPHSDFCFK